MRPDRFASPRALPAIGAACLAALVALASVGCKIEKKSATEAAANANPVDNFEDKSFDPQKQVGSIWDGKVMPALQKRAADYAPLRAAMHAGLDAAGAKYGYRERGEGAPWNFVTQLAGTVVEADTASGAGTIGVDVDHDGKPDATVQIGPVLRGTSLRDNLDFISFSNYSNQVEFAQLADAFNQQAYDRVLKALPRDRLVGAQVALVGTFTTDDADDVPLITPVQMTVTPAK